MQIIIDYLQAARDALKFYKNTKCNTIEEVNAINVELQHLIAVNDQLNISKSLTLADFRRSSVYKGLIFAMILPIIFQFSMNFILMVYGVQIFKDTKSNVDPKYALIILGVVQIFGNLCTLEVVEKLGRRFLLIFSLCGCCFGQCTLIMYSYFDSLEVELSWARWVPVVSCGCITFASSTGIIPLTMIAIAESVPTKVSISHLFLGHDMIIFFFA